MPRPPSKHGLERKYKPWRKGKSKMSKSKGSLKQQLRGAERLLAKMSEAAAAAAAAAAETTAESTDAEERQRRQEIQERIEQLKNQIEEKERVETERQNAKESHGLRFLERQRLTRAERSTRKLLASARTTTDDTERYEMELKRIALDQVYVAHFPHDVKYLPLFRNGVRMVDVKRKLVKRALTRKRILHNLADVTSSSERVKWIAPDQYERLPKEWSVELEMSTFAAAPGANGYTAEAAINDNRFANSAAMSQHAALLEAAEQAEAAVRIEEINRSQHSSNEDSSSDSSDDDADPLTGCRTHPNKNRAKEQSSDSTSSDSSDSSSDSEVEMTLPQSARRINQQTNERSDSDGDSSDGTPADGLVTDPALASTKKRNTTIRTSEEFDDFLMPPSDGLNAFEKAKQEAGYDRSRPDKSKGWATQRQRPGQFKKRRIR